jgi:hypothetical protein
MVINEEHRCSFCLKPEREVEKIIAGPGSYICDRCVRLCVDILATDHDPTRDGAEPDLPSWSVMTDEALLARLPLIAGSADQVEAALESWVGEARRREASWARIGQALGMTRQAAWERFTQAR